MNGFRKLKNDDKGMTLVEVIIAITILGIVVVPVLRSLTTSMAYNAKARVRQELTLTAESIMESFKGYGVTKDDGMVERFADGTGLSGLMSGDTLNGVSYSCEYSTDAWVTSTDINSGTDLSLLPVGAEYTFKVSGLVSNSKTYDVEITAKPNSTLDVYVPADSASDAVFAADRSWDTGALSKAEDDFKDDTNGYADALAGVFGDLLVDAAVEEAESVSGTTVKEKLIYITDGADEYDLTDSTVVENQVFSDIGNYISLYSREITFTIDNNGAAADVEYGYRVSGYPYIIRLTKEIEDDDTGKKVTRVDEISGTLDADKLGVMSFTAESGLSVYSGSGLERLYIYYYPQYSLNGGDDKITIKIDNTCSLNDLDCYIVKQSAPELTDAQIQTKESSYAPKVAISNSLGKAVNVYHNLDINIGGGSTTGYSSSRVSGASSVYSLSSSDILNSASALTDEKTLSYTVSLKVTQQDTGSEVTSLESTVIEGID